MPPRGVKKPKRKRQYDHVKESERKRGRSEAVAEEIAARTVNKTRARKSESKTKSRRTRPLATTRQRSSSGSSRLANRKSSSKRKK
jgi:hypothetical protein